MHQARLTSADDAERTAGSGGEESKKSHAGGPRDLLRVGQVQFLAGGVGVKEKQGNVKFCGGKSSSFHVQRIHRRTQLLQL